MFGYIVLSNKAEKEDKRVYRECYCGLCHTLKEKYGRTGMLSLSYDMTFLSLLLSDLSSQEKTEGIERCPVHPLKKHNYFVTPVMDYTSDMQMLLSYYSLLDSIHDENKGVKREKSYLEFIPSIEKKYPRQTKAVKENLGVISSYEEKNIKDVEKPALAFGNLLGEIFVYDEKSFFKEDLFLLGCSLGKFIYILDAWDDRDRDMKKGLYNPFDDSVTYTSVKDMLLDAASSASDCYNRLPLDEYTSIMDNIIYSGMWTKFNNRKKDGQDR